MACSTVSSNNIPETDLKKSASSPSATLVEHNEEADLTVFKAIKKDRRCIKYVLAVCPAVLLFGYDGVLVSNLTAMPVFQADFGALYDGAYIIPATWLSVWTAASPVGIMAGAGLAGYVHDRFGRRWSLVVGSLIGMIGIAICFGSSYPNAIATRRSVFLIGKLAEGLCTGQVICTAQTYVSEIVPHRIRGAAFALFPAFTLLGQLLAAVVIFSQIYVTTSVGYLTCIATQWVFSLAVIIGVIYVPESPIWLVRMNRIDSATRSENRLQSSAAPEVVIAKLVETIEREKRDSQEVSGASLLHCFKGTNRRRTMLIIFANMIPQLFGTVFLGSASYFFQLLGMEAALALELLQVGIAVGFVANLLGMWTVTRFERRPLMLVTLITMAVLWLSMAISGFWRGTVPLWWTLTTFMLVIFTAGLGAWPVSVVMASELSSLKLRGKSQAIGWVVQGLSTGVFSIFLPYIYNPDAGNSGGKVAFLFVGLCLITSTIVWFYLPETKGRTAAEINTLFINRITARQWKGRTLHDLGEELGDRRGAGSV